MKEQDLQRAVVDFLGYCVPLPPSGPFWTAINPIPAKSKAAAGISKAMGLRPGMPDILLIWQGRFIGIELKTDSGHLSKAQLNAHENIRTAGGQVSICRSVDEVIVVLDGLGIPTRLAA